ncbi:hypothetical protein GT347_17385 [Xylophilus rhododendri]|uniref:Uncharacterized protein n=1 Tax=Xylophilus rhododendri TaxID=2697032 RepID=A0A857J961_9BURK|nr:hypothetical protein [Xylophilus rhododendri]QHI99589.1 hypothetical protein GT347_17385 [Xylophilus rhododendri]
MPFDIPAPDCTDACFSSPAASAATRFADLVQALLEAAPHETSDLSGLHAALAAVTGDTDPASRPDRTEETRYHLDKRNPAGKYYWCDPGIGPFRVAPLLDVLKAIALARRRGPLSNEDRELLARLAEMLPEALRVECGRDSRLDAIFHPPEPVAVPAVLDSSAREQLRADLASGRLASPQALADALVGAAHRYVIAELTKAHPDKAVPIGNFSLRDINRRQIVPVAQTDEFFTQQQPFIVDSLHAALMRIADELGHAGPQATEASASIDSTISTGLILFNQLMELQAAPGWRMHAETLRKLATRQPSTVDEMRDILSRSMAARMLKEAKFGYARGTQWEEEKTLHFFWGAERLLLRPESRMVLGRVLQDQLIAAKEQHARAVARRQKLDPALTQALVDSAASHVEHYFGFMSSEARPFVRPPEPAAPPAAARPDPLQRYRRAIDELDEGTDIDDPQDPRFVSGGDFLARSNALLAVSRAEQQADAAGEPFDHQAFATASIDPDVIASAGYLKTLFDRWAA